MSCQNIDLLNVGKPCAQNCRQCFAKEHGRTERTSEETAALAQRVMDVNPESAFFVYPQEAMTAPESIGLMQRAGQTFVLSTGTTYDPGTVDQLRNAGIEEVRVTLFPTAEEQHYWNKNTEEEYERIKKNITLYRDVGMRVQTYTMITPQNMMLFPAFYEQANALGVARMGLLRLLPVGNGKTVDRKHYIGETELEELLTMTDALKQPGKPYISMSMRFGPDFTGRKAWEYLRGEGKSWAVTDTLCPTVDNQYQGVSLNTHRAYWCFMLQSEPEAAIGTLAGNGKIQVTRQPDFSRATLAEKLRGICAKDACEYQGVCYGGCRAFAYTFAKLRGETELEYAGMDICRTQTRKRMRCNS